MTTIHNQSLRRELEIYHDDIVDAVAKLRMWTTKIEWLCQIEHDMAYATPRLRVWNAEIETLCQSLLAGDVLPRQEQLELAMDCDEGEV